MSKGILKENNKYTSALKIKADVRPLTNSKSAVNFFVKTLPELRKIWNNKIKSAACQSSLHRRWTNSMRVYK